MATFVISTERNAYIRRPDPEMDSYMARLNDPQDLEDGLLAVEFEKVLEEFIVMANRRCGALVFHPIYPKT